MNVFAPMTCTGPFTCANNVTFTSVIQTSPTACPSLLAITLQSCTGTNCNCITPATTSFNQFMMQLDGVYLITGGVCPAVQDGTVGIIVNNQFVVGTGVGCAASDLMTAFTAQLALSAGDVVALGNVGNQEMFIVPAPANFCNCSSAFINFTYVGPLCTNPP